MENSKKKAAIGFIFITLLIDITGWGIIIPVVPKLIEELIHDISEAAKYGGWLGFAYAFTQFIFSPLVGNLSDKYGRRPIILISLFGFAVDYIFLALAPSIWWLFLGRVIAGLPEQVSLRRVPILRIFPRMKTGQKLWTDRSCVWTWLYYRAGSWRCSWALRCQSSFLCCCWSLLA
jgi:MFS family permease